MKSELNEFYAYISSETEYVFKKNKKKNGPRTNYFIIS